MFTKEPPSICQGGIGTDGSEIKHKLLWQQVEKLAKQHKRIRMVQITPHMGKGPLRWGNEQADELAKEAALTGTRWEPWQ